MRQSAHNGIRLAVSLLLGVMYLGTPMANTAFASTSNPALIANVFSATDGTTPCKNIFSASLLGLDASLTPSTFEQVSISGMNKLVITSPKDSRTSSFTPVETVLKKATEGDLEGDIVVKPSPTVYIPVNSPTTFSNIPVAPTASGSVLNADTLFNLVNATRSQYGLPAFEKNDQLCAVVNSRAPEVDNEIWVTHTMHAGFYGRNLPYWATENLISMGSEQAALNWWLNSPVHRSAVLGSWKNACVACAGRSCSMIFSNMEPKYAAPQRSTTLVPVALDSTPGVQN